MNPSAEPASQVIATTEAPLELTAAETDVLLRVDPKQGRALMAALAAGGRLELRLEGITGNRPANLAVYLGLGDEPDSIFPVKVAAGVVGLYGIAPAERHGAHSGSGGPGLGFALEVSQVLTSLLPAGAPPPGRLRVSLVPTRSLGAQLRIGKISLLQSSRA